MAPDERWLPFLKILLGYLLVFLMATLAAVIALGHVTEKTSYGLQGIIGGLMVLAGGFAQWAFGANSETKHQDDDSSDDKKD